MNYDNAKKGIGRIYTAEILEILATIVAIVAVVLMTVLGAILKDGESVNVTDVISVISLVVSGVIAIVAFFLTLTGINTASKDEESFKTALIMLFVQFGAYVLSTVFTNKGGLSSILEAVSNIAELLVVYYIIHGCINIAVKKGNKDVETAGNNAIRIYMIVWVVGIVVNFLAGMINKGGAMSVVVAILSVGALILAIIGYIIYLKVLRKTVDML